MLPIERIFSLEYIKHIEELEKASIAYQTVPNQYTYQILQNLKARQFSAQERFTSEYIEEYRNMKETQREAAQNEIKHLLNTFHIEDLYEGGKINENRRIELHLKNDFKYNQNSFQL